MGLVFHSAAEAIAAVGMDLGHSAWLQIDQARIDAFAEATGDHQWIHVDPARAALGPFGKTIAHGYLTFSLVNLFLPELFIGEGMKFAVNYGTNKLRFPSPVPVGSRIRANGRFAAAEMVNEVTLQTTVAISIEIEGQDKPGCIADILGRYYF